VFWRGSKKGKGECGGQKLLARGQGSRKVNGKGGTTLKGGRGGVRLPYKAGAEEGNGRRFWGREKWDDSPGSSTEKIGVPRDRTSQTRQIGRGGATRRGRESAKRGSTKINRQR